MNDPWLRAAGGVLWVIGAFIVVLGAFASLLRMLPGLHLRRGVLELAIIFAAGTAVLTWRLLFDRGWHS